MESKDNIHAQLQPLVDALLGPVQWRLVETAIRVRLFDELIQPQTANEVAVVFGWQPGTTEVFMDGLCSLRVLCKNEGKYYLPSFLKDALCSKSAHYIGGVVLHLADIRHKGLSQFEAVLRGEECCTEVSLDESEFWHRNADNLLQFHRCIGVHEQLMLLQSLPEWNRVSAVLDLGCGSEALAESVLQAHPEKNVCLFDLPGCINRIRARLSEQSPIRLQSGNYNAFSLTGTYDLIWASMTLYYVNDLVEFLVDVRSSLSEYGVFVSFHEGLEQERTQPCEHVVGRLMPAIRGYNLSFDKGRIRSAMREAGFSDVEHRKVNTLFGPMELDVARI